MSERFDEAIDRRGFLKKTAAVAAGAAAISLAGWPDVMAKAYAQNNPGAGVGRGPNGVLTPPPKRGIILYSVRDRISAAPDDTGVPYGFERVFERLAEIGYKQIEFAGYNQNQQILGRQITAQEIRKALDDNGLKANGTHLNVNNVINNPNPANWEQQLENAEILGLSHIGTGSAPTGNAYPDEWQQRAELWNERGRQARQRGLKLYTHNHHAEYQFLLDSGPLDGNGNPTRSSGIRRLEYFMELTDPQWVFFEMDIYWGYVAQFRHQTYVDPDGNTQTSIFDPLQTVADRTIRFPLFHAKDGESRPDLDNGYLFVPLGQGDIDFRTFFQEMGARGYHLPNWEQDNAPGGSADPGQSLRFAEISYDHMANLRG
jgi:sugar phosphate isomerase/epimerase